MDKKFRFSFQANNQNSLQFQTFTQRMSKRRASISLDQSSCKKIIETINRAQSAQKEIDILKKQNYELQQQLQELKQKQAKHSSQKREIQRKYLRQIQQLSLHHLKIEQTKTAKQKNYQQQVQKYKNKVSELQSQIQSLKIKYSQSQQHNRRLQIQHSQLNTNINLLKKDLFDFKQSCYNNIRNPLLKPQLKNLFKSKIAKNIVVYLYPKQINNLFLLNQEMYIYLAYNPSINHCRLSIVRSIHSSRNELAISQINYHRLISQKVPQQIIKRAILRYMFLHRQAGIYMAPVINKASQIFDITCLQLKDQITFDQQLSLINHPQDKIKKDDQILSIINSAIKKQQQKGHQLGQLFNSSKQSIQQYLNSREQSMQQILQETTDLSQKLSKLSQNFPSQRKSQFQQLLYQNYVRLFVYSKVITQQSRVLQQISHCLFDLVVNKYKYDMQRISQIEDLQTSIQSQKKSKQYFSNKSSTQQNKILILQNEALSQQLKIKKLLESQTKLKNKVQQLTKQLQSTRLKTNALQQQCRNLTQSNQLLTKQLSLSQNDIQTIKNIVSDLQLQR